RPIRTAHDRTALVDGLKRGVIAIVGTDHALHTDDEKAQDLEAAPAGSPGVQTLYLSCLQIARRLGDVWLAPGWVSKAPARLAGLDKSKGTVAPGFDADIVLVDPRRKTRVTARDMSSRQRPGALEGMEFDFAIRATYLRGEKAGEDGKGRGRMVRPALVVG